MTPERDDTYPALVVVFCDECGREHAGDYLVRDSDNSATRLGYARTHMTALGWAITPGLDLCPACAPREAAQ